MSNQLNRPHFEKFINFINTSDESLGRDVIADNVMFYVPGQQEPLRGLQGYTHVLMMMKSAFPDISWTLQDAIYEDDKVAARFVIKGTHQGNFYGIEATGITINATAANFYRFENGKIVEEYGQPDLLSILQQLGAIKS